MSAPRSTSGVTPPRLVALALIALLVGALVALRAAAQPQGLSVPDRAVAGDLVLRPCHHETEDGVRAAECGTLVVPENHEDHDSPLIALPVVRLRAESAQPGVPLFYLEGGPGITNVDFAEAGRYAAERDVVLVGYRGVDGSVRLECPEVVDAQRQLTDVLGDRSFRAYGEALAGCAERLRAEGVDPGQYGLPQQVEDLELARTALGYDRIDLLSQSAGTRTALIYAWSHPERIHRSVMVGVNPPGHFLWDTETSDEQIRRYAALCAQDLDCSRRTDDLAATMRSTTADLPDRWLFLPISAGSVRLYSFYGLMESTSQEPMSAPMTLDAWLAAAAGDPSGFWVHTVLGDLLPLPIAWGQYAAAGRVDAAAMREYFAEVEPDPTNLGWVGSAFAWAGGQTVEGWPAVPGEDAYRAVRTSTVETLLVGGELDFSTPPQHATEDLLPSLPNGHEVVIPGLGHTASFFAEQPEAGTHLINTFLASGRVDDSHYRPQVVDFTPATSLPTIGKIMLATMVGFVLLMLLVLLSIGRRIRRHGSLGGAGRLAARIASPAVTGPGGWFLALLIVMVAFPGHPLDGQLLAAVSVSVPVGLAIYGAWVHRTWPPRRKAAGIAGSLVSAFAGAWLGFLVVDGLAAIGTTIIGAALATNLALLVDALLSGRASARPDATVPPQVGPLPAPGLRAGSPALHRVAAD